MPELRWVSTCDLQGQATTLALTQMGIGNHREHHFDNILDRNSAEVACVGQPRCPGQGQGFFWLGRRKDAPLGHQKDHCQRLRLQIFWQVRFWLCLKGPERCSMHKSTCPWPEAVDLDISGTPCVGSSTMGDHLGKDDPSSHAQKFGCKIRNGRGFWDQLLKCQLRHLLCI